MVFRLILPDYALAPTKPKVMEGEFTADQLQGLNNQGYNIYYLPNYPSLYDGGTVDGSKIDTFDWCMIDMDLKDKVYADKYEFIEAVGRTGIDPSRIVDSGNGLHVYWRVTDLDALSFLKLTRRLVRLLKTDTAVGKIYQLMRYPGYKNTKDPVNQPLCELIYESEKTYTAEELDSKLPLLTKEDELFCNNNYDLSYNIKERINSIKDALPPKFGELLRNSNEVKRLFSGEGDDRSKDDYRLGHIMFANGFSKEDAASVLINTAKAISRAPIHRTNYAYHIIDKIWTYELEPQKAKLKLSKSVKELISQGEEAISGTRFPCHRYIDATESGFKLGQVIGLVAGSGVGKTAMALNMFYGFVANNPAYDHFFVPLEQTDKEIALRWKKLCGDNTHLHDKVHVMPNYNDDGTFRHLSLEDIKNYLLEFMQVSGRKIGCVVIDHIGALQKSAKHEENQGIIGICHQMKAFAIQTNTLLVMQSQSNREKAGIGDIELNKDAAYGTVFFESYVDYLVTIWQPLKRSYPEGAPTVTAFKFCKIRHKNIGKDCLQEDVSYRLLFDPNTERMRELTELEEKSFDYFNKQATNKRKADRKTDIIPYQSISWTKKEDELYAKANHDSNNTRFQ